MLVLIPLLMTMVPQPLLIQYILDRASSGVSIAISHKQISFQIGPKFLWHTAMVVLQGSKEINLFAIVL